MTITFTKATRFATKLKIGIDGPSGSGKTEGALALATGITKGGRIAVADSENGSASLYADRYAFDTVPLTEANPGAYKAIIDAAAEAGYDALVIDSLSHAWLAVLAAKESHDLANPTSNSWTNWRKFGPQWDDLMQHILRAPLHVIATMRSKQAYEQVEQNGRKSVVKLGLQPQVRDGAEYEFGLVFSVNQAHRAEATKDRTGIFGDALVDLTDAKIHTALVQWMNAGGVAEPVKPVTPVGVPLVLTREDVITWGKYAGTQVRALDDEYLEWAVQDGRKLGPDTLAWQDVMREEIYRRVHNSEDTPL